MTNRNTLILIWLITILTSCISRMSPTHKSSFWGISMTCITDSTFFTSEPVLKLKAGIPFKNGKFRQSYINPKCENIPNYVSILPMWPSKIILDFKKHHYYFLHSPHPVYPENDFKTENFPIAYRLDLGKLIYNRTINEITLSSEIYTWTRTFGISFSPSDSILILTSKNGY